MTDISFVFGENLAFLEPLFVKIEGSLATRELQSTPILVVNEKRGISFGNPTSAVHRTDSDLHFVCLLQ